MTALDRPHDRGDEARLTSLTVADEPEAWERAGFSVVDGAVALAATSVLLTGRDTDQHGIVGWSLAGLDAPAGPGTLDGLATTFTETTDIGTDAADDPAAPPGPTHPNGATGLDHVVVHTPDLTRTMAAFAAVGLAVRRIRETDSYGAPMRQAFLRTGPTVVEVVSGHDDSGQDVEEAPAGWFGLAIDVDDLDAVAASLGDALGTIKPAVQDGRRIATIRHRPLGMSVAVALMDHRG